MSSISDLMIDAARALRFGAHESIVALALKADGVNPTKIDTIMRWCKLYNQRTQNQEMPVIDTDFEEVEDGYDHV